SDSEFEKRGSGTLTLSGNAASNGSASFLGTVFVSEGTLKLAANHTFNSGTDITLTNDGRLDVTQSQHIRRLSSEYASTRVTIASGKELTVDLPTETIEDETVPMASVYAGQLKGSGSLIKAGPGRLTLAGASPWFH